MIEQIYDAFNIPYTVQPNDWINTTCPFCDDTKEHLGCAPDSLVFNCWRCGWHPTYETIARLLNISESEVPKILEQYHLRRRTTSRKETNKKVNIYPFKYPKPYITKLEKPHRSYLRKRKLDPKKITNKWGLLATGPVSFLDKIDFKYRIIIPIMWNDQVVSFQSRDITERSSLKYITCPENREIVHHKHIVYGNQKYWEYDRVGIVTEGVTDVWRLGPLACATFGMNFTIKQVMEIAHHFDRIFVVFDNEKQAQKQAKKLATKIRMLGKEAYVEKIGNNSDPGSMSQDDADHFVRQLIGRNTYGRNID